jgi:hypothetical protein
VHAAAASRLLVTAQPPILLDAGQAFGLVVAAVDPFGNLDLQFQGSVALALASNPGGATLGGPTTVSAVNGEATFAGLTLDRGGRYTLQAASGGLTGTSTAALDVNPPPVTADGAGVVVTPPGTVEAVAIPPPPVKVAGVSVSSSAVPTAAAKRHGGGKHRASLVIVVQFDGALNAAAASNPGAYALTTIARGKHHKGRPVALALAQASYNPATHAVTLTPAKRLALRTPLQLRLNASALTDGLGRPLDGNHDGRPGGDFLATLSPGGVSIAAAGPPGRPAAPAVDALMAAGFRPGGRR